MKKFYSPSLRKASKKPEISGPRSAPPTQMKVINQDGAKGPKYDPVQNGYSQPLNIVRPEDNQYPIRRKTPRYARATSANKSPSRMPPKPVTPSYKPDPARDAAFEEFNRKLLASWTHTGNNPPLNFVDYDEYQSDGHHNEYDDHHREYAQTEKRSIFALYLEKIFRYLGTCLKIIFWLIVMIYVMTRIEFG